MNQLKQKRYTDMALEILPFMAIDCVMTQDKMLACKPMAPSRYNSILMSTPNILGFQLQPEAVARVNEDMMY